MSDKKVPSMGIKNACLGWTYVIHTMNIHNPYGSITCIRFEGIISAFPSEGKAPLCYFGSKCKGKGWDYKENFDFFLHVLVELEN